MPLARRQFSDNRTLSRSKSLKWSTIHQNTDQYFDERLFTSTHNEDPPCGDWFVTAGIRLPFLPTRWSATHTPNPSIRVESELRLTVRESQSQGFGASLDVPESSRLTKTLLPGA